MKTSLPCLFITLLSFNIVAQNAASIKVSSGLNATTDATFTKNGFNVPDKEAKTYRLNLPSVAVTMLHNKKNNSYLEAAYNNYELRKSINQTNGKMESTANLYKGMLDLTYNLQSRYIKETAFRMHLGLGTSFFIDRAKCTAVGNTSSYTRIHTGLTSLIIPKIQYWFSDQNFIEVSLPMRTLWFGLVTDKSYEPKEAPTAWKSISNSSIQTSLPPNWFHIGLGYQFGKTKKPKGKVIKKK
jgi:hypothetical protein